MVDSTIKVTTNFAVTTDAKGNMSASATSTVENVSGKQWSAGQLATMGKITGAMQQAAVGRGFGSNTTQLVTAIGIAETRLGTQNAAGAPSFKAADINPMQLSGGRANMDLTHNINGAMDVLKYAGKPSDFDPTKTYTRFSDGGKNTMANWNGTYNSLVEY